MFIVKVYGQSCNYYLGINGSGTLKLREAVAFFNEGEARRYVYSCIAVGRFNTHWEIQEVKKIPEWSNV